MTDYIILHSRLDLSFIGISHSQIRLLFLYFKIEGGTSRAKGFIRRGYNNLSLHSRLDLSFIGISHSQIRLLFLYFKIEGGTSRAKVSLSKQ
ncbi:hypothetical protein DEO72_LG4g7 [Vigna unguiculata]|uniref:Uncharacterized protein n=1 Tax=Vigna unguiculata TaxID=3917 RepID=A0A4D6LK26_VIGUN|nr:hypothetical protein DEO72_LG4g7 [Vigna unguiculata]